jgi:hypothetical protein
MTILTTTQEVEDYLTRIDNQKDVLITSPIFPETDKITICRIFEELKEICLKNKARYMDVIDATRL